jgi:hypothetical protein
MTRLSKHTCPLFHVFPFPSRSPKISKRPEMNQKTPLKKKTCYTGNAAHPSFLGEISIANRIPRHFSTQSAH